MRRPDRIGTLVISFAAFAVYIGIAHWYRNWSGLSSLPLGTIDVLPVLAIDLTILNLYIIRQRKHVQTEQAQ